MKKLLKTLTVTLSGTVFLSLSAFSLQTSDYKRLGKMFDEVASKTAYSVTDLEALFQKVEIQPRIIEIMDKPAESMPWYQYRKIFLTEKNISKGAEYWIKHADTLARAEKKFGVPPEIIIATLGVETRYGTNTGGFRVIDALTTLGLEYPRRSEYFTKELKNFLLLSDENRLNPLAVTGSYAGAIGLPQFMPSSYRAYAVDFNGDGYSDLVNSVEDAIGSIASYYSEHGWEPGQPISWSTRGVRSKANKMVVKKRKTDRVLNDFLQKGFALQEQIDPQTPAGLIKLEGEKGPEYRVAFDNFFVITRYNTSMLYATAVQLLGEEIKSRVKATK
ncbi:MAG: lytic murein transglycosylase B [Gammaproteobacteria bacterium]|nr:lytic murein transglycosylase B [Gammaproteobacteria bacterium]